MVHSDITERLIGSQEPSQSSELQRTAEKETADRAYKNTHASMHLSLLLIRSNLLDRETIPKEVQNCPQAQTLLRR